MTVQLAVERAFQAAIEACIDIAAHIVSVYELGKTEESRDIFRFLAEAGYIDESFATSMTAMVFLLAGSWQNLDGQRLPRRHGVRVLDKEKIDAWLDQVK